MKNNVFLVIHKVEGIGVANGRNCNIVAREFELWSRFFNPTLPVQTFVTVYEIFI